MTAEDALGKAPAGAILGPSGTFTDPVVLTVLPTIPAEVKAQLTMVWVWMS